MFDILIGYILYFIGINKTLPMVKGDSIDLIASASASTSGSAVKPWKIARKVKNATEAAYLVSLLKTRNAEMENKIAKIQETSLAGWQSKNTEFQKRLATVKSDKKIATATRIQQELVQINTKRTTIMNTHLKKMGEILETISTKVSALSSLTGKDLALINNAVATSQQTIQDALDAVEVQAGKSYSITITSGESTLKNDVDIAHKNLETDLKATQAKVVAARLSVETAIKEFRKLSPWKEGEQEKPASTATPTGVSATATPNVLP